uniref:Coiled-coil domain containing 120a n=1 Tax=Salmo trutta TaxID=8032 RepID=A0A673X6K9_SALTR
QAHIKRTVHRGCHTGNNTHLRHGRSVLANMDAPYWRTWTLRTGEHGRSVLANMDAPYRLRPVLILCYGLVVVVVVVMLCVCVSLSSPRRTLPRRISNVEGTSVPDTQLITWSTPVVLPQSLDVGSSSGPSSGSSSGLSSDPSSGPSSDPSSGPSSGSYEGGGSCPCSNQQRSSSSEALLNRTTSCNEGGHGQVQGQRSRGMPFRGGPPYKSSEALTDGHLRQLNVQRSSPERQLVNGHGVEHNRLVGRVSVGVRGRGRGDRGGYGDILKDYVWWKQQRQVEQVHGNGKFPSSVPASSLSHFNGPQPLHLSEGPPAYRSPLMLRGKPGEPRRVKVTRTKSCGPFIPLQQNQQEAVLSSSSSSSFDLPLPPSSSSSSSTGTLTAALPPLYSDSITPDDPTRSLHKALALEGLRDWYLRNTMGGLEVEAGLGVKVRTTNSLHESHPHQLPHQPQAYQGDYHTCQLPQSQTFQGQPLHGKLVRTSGPYHGVRVSGSSPRRYSSLDLSTAVPAVR